MLRNACCMSDEGGKTSSLKSTCKARLDSQRGRAGVLKQPQVPCHITDAPITNMGTCNELVPLR